MASRISRSRAFTLALHVFSQEVGKLIPSLLQSKKANFDSTHELEELLLEDNPLKARKRKANQDPGALSAEMRQMEEQ